MNKSSCFEIDNITWNDLSLDEIYSRLNSCISTAGEDYLREALKNPYICRCDSYDSTVNLINDATLYKDDDRLKSALSYISKLQKYRFTDEIKSISESENTSNTKHYIIDILVILSFVSIFFLPGPGIVAFFVMIGYSVSDYFKTKNMISGHLSVFNYLIRMIKSLSKYHLKNIDGANEYNLKLNRLTEISKVFRSFVRGTYIISEGAKTTSNPLSILFDYIRMIFHVDIIKYNSMISFIETNADLAIEYYEIIGELDACMSVNGFKTDIENANKYVCVPEFTKEHLLKITEGHHLMLKNSTANSISTAKNVLITGCNASGKSTFLKMTALNILFAQCFGFVLAKEYTAPFFRIYSSMALKDDITKGESYYIAEIKSLKRILDACLSDDNETERIPVFCVVDEVLRGTNTVERIAASTEILLELSRKNTMCFTATHDIELTELLCHEFNNYHFSEEFDENDVKFSYKIEEGPANSSNAIKLLKVIGYNESIVANSSRRVDNFLSNGKYSV